MFTRCTECKKIQSITLEQLRDSRGMRQCSHCAALFDALVFISETGETDTGEKNVPIAEDLPWNQEKHPKNVSWALGTGLCFLLLVAQIVFFEGHAYTQHGAIRPFLTALCEHIGCHLPDYQNPDELNLVGSLNRTPGHYYELQAAISNQAAFPQAYPYVKLTLLDYNGNPFAARIFRPEDYLPESSHASVIKPDDTTEIRLKIAAPKSAIGGSAFELIY